MGIIKHLKSVLPLPRKWTDDEKAFALRLEDAYRDLQVQRMNDLAELKASALGLQYNDRDHSFTDLDDVPVGVWGRGHFSADVNPSGSASYLNYICIGTESYHTIVAFALQNGYFNTKNGTQGWQGWRKFTVTTV